MVIIVGRGPILNNVAFSTVDSIKSEPIVSRGYRVEGISIWTYSDQDGKYQIQLYVPDGTEAPEEFKESNWADWEAVQVIVADTLHKYRETGGFLAMRTVFTPDAAVAGTVYQEATFFGGG